MANLLSEAFTGADGSEWPAGWTHGYSSYNDEPHTASRIVGGRGRQTTTNGIPWGYSLVTSSLQIPGLGATWDIQVDVTVDGDLNDDWFVSIFANSNRVYHNDSWDLTPTKGNYIWLGWDPTARVLYAQQGISKGGAAEVFPFADIPGLAYTPGSTYTIRAVRNGYTFKLWAWAAGTAQPVEPQAQFTDPGDVALDDTWLELNATNGQHDTPFNADWDNLVVIYGDPAPVFTETFNGADGDPWSSAWSSPDPGSSTIQGNKGRLSSASNSWWVRRARANLPNLGDTDFTGTVVSPTPGMEQFVSIIINADNTWKPGAWETGNCYILYLAYNDSSNGPGLIVARATTDAGSVNLASAPKTLVNTTTYGFRFQRFGQLLRAKVWEAALPEPAAWDISYTLTEPPMTGSVALASDNGGTAVVCSFDFDNLIVSVPKAMLLGYFDGRPVTAMYYGAERISATM